jgi:hypothetical protein
MDYLKVGKATELTGRARVYYRLLEIMPGFLSISTLLILLIMSYFQPVWVAYFIIAFNVYWLLLVIYLALHLISAYSTLRRNSKIDWRAACVALPETKGTEKMASDSLAAKGWRAEDLIQLVILPTYNEGVEILRSCLQSLVEDGFPVGQMFIVLALEERAGEAALEKGRLMTAEFAHQFGRFVVTVHPDNIVGELKAKGANQAYAAKKVKADIIDPEHLDYGKIVVSVFDIDTVVIPGYFYRLAYKFLTVSEPYRASYQPVPMYHNNIWQAPFFARVAATSGTFWQMMQQIRAEKLTTYSSHSMTWKALVDIDFWSTHMVSEDSRIFCHCFLYYNGDYRVEPLYFPISMDVTMDRNMVATAKSLYMQQRRWAWGAENIPYLIFNTALRWKQIDRRQARRHILVQIYGFHSWATHALIICVVGWMPLILGGDRFHSTVLSSNLPGVTSTLMNMAMVGLLLSAVISTLLLPPRPKNFRWWRWITMVLEWLFVPVSIIIFGAVPCLDAQIRLMLGKYMGFWITPKNRA